MDLLTSEEIQSIIQIVRFNPVWRHPDVMIFSKQEKTGVMNVTPKNGIIIIWGNSDTGFNHIKERHDYWSMKNYFVDSDKGKKLDNPSRFNRKSLPIVDYINISESLYTPTNLNTEKNKYPEVFDMYSGQIEDETNGVGIYHMLLYRSTKILHSLYPQSKTNNSYKKIFKLLKYAKGQAKAELHFNPFVVAIGLPYRDINDIPRYSFEVLRNYEEMIEIGVIRDLKRPEGRIDLFERIIEKPFEQHQLDLDIDYFHNQDLTEVEKIIKNYDSKTYGD